VTLQVLSADEYRGAATRQTHRELELPARRGRLYDRNREPLALSLTAASVYANPRTLGTAGVDPGPIADQLAPILGQDPASVREALTRDANFTYIARQVPRELGQRIAELKLPGVGVLDEPTRSYPAGSLAGPVIGRAGIDHVGLSGLEAQYDQILAGRPGTLQMELAPGGVEISVAPRTAKKKVPGADLVLSLDREIQAAAEAALTGAVERHKAEGGSAIVLDVRSGEVLAMASMPTTEGEGAGRNRGITDAYEPGSVNKVITISGALEEGVFHPGNILTVPDRYTVSDKTFSDAHEHETAQWSVAEIMARSSNVGTIKIAETLGAERLHGYVERFGYGQPSGLGLPGESPGLLPAPADWSATSLPTIAIGYGVSATLLQVAGVYATIANGGESIQPSLVRGTVAPDGALTPAPPPQRRRVVSPETAQSVTQMLIQAVESEEGTGGFAAVPGYRVAGKTGTARKPSQTSRGYEPGAYVSSFAGFAPAEDPALVVAVTIDEPHAGYYGGTVAGPAFRELMTFALAAARIPPSDPSRAATPEAVPTPTAVASPGATATPSSD